MTEAGSDGKSSIKKDASDAAMGQIDQLQHGLESDEIDLFELIERIWSRRLLVAFTVLLCVAGALAYLFTSTPLYEISMLVRPGVTGYEKREKGGGVCEVRGWTTRDIAQWVKTGLYRHFLPRVSNSDEEKVIKLEARVTKGSNAVGLVFYHDDPSKGTELLKSLYSNILKYYVDNDGDPQVALTKRELLSRIQGLKDQLRELQLVERVKLNMRILELKEKLKLYNKKIEMAKKRQRTDARTLKQMQDRETATLKNTADLVKLRNDLIAKQRTQDISLLLYTNIVQQNIYYVSNLQQKIANLQKAILADEEKEAGLRNEVKRINQEIEKIKLKIEQQLPHREEELRRQIGLAQKRISALAPIEKISDPIASARPVKPKKALVLAVACVLGIFTGIFLALFIDGYVTRQKARD